MTDEQDVEARYPNGAVKEWPLLAKRNIFFAKVRGIFLFQLDFSKAGSFNFKRSKNAVF